MKEEVKMNVKKKEVNMADERQQKVDLCDQEFSISDGLSQIETFESSREENKIHADSLQQTLHKTDDFSETSSLSNSQNSILHENIHPLCDHSYIHSSHSNINVQTSDVNSHDTDSSDTCLKQDPVSEVLQLPPILTFEESNNVSNINSHVIEPSNFSSVLNKNSLNGDVLSYSSINESPGVDVFTDVETVETTTSMNSLTLCNKSENKTPTLVNFNPLFVVNKLESNTLTTTLSASHDLSSIKVPVKQTNAPLGSVENPIQIIQNGSSYVATQTLTDAQKQQITHVLQKQQAKKALETEGRSVIYDPSTNTRIVCRIVHPSELQSQKSVAANIELPSKELQPRHTNTFRGRGRPRKLQYRKIKVPEEKVNPVLSKEERDEKKKHRPRTRSGRISKPPTYMVKDYKRIHHLDFNEEPHDSDGGYSDYQVSDEEGEKRAAKSNTLPPGNLVI